jgi:hypothetical protein
MQGATHSRLRLPARRHSYRSEAISTTSEPTLRLIGAGIVGHARVRGFGQRAGAAHEANAP